MTDLIRRFRGLGIAVVVLAMSAGVVFAGAPRFAPVSDSTPNLEEPSAEAPSGDPSAEPSEDASDDASDDAGESAEPAESGDVEAPDASAEASDNHGALVSEAAQMSTPPDFANHGAFVSCVAKMKDVAAASFDWTTVTPESCGQAPTEDAAASPAVQPGQQGRDRAQGAKTKAHGHAAGHGKPTR